MCWSSLSRISFGFVFGFNFTNKSRYLFGRWLLFSLLLLLTRLLLLSVLISHPIRLFAFKCFVKDDEICIFVKVKILIVLVFDRELCIQLLCFVLGCLPILPEKCTFFAASSLCLSFFNICSSPVWSGWNAPRSILLSFHITVFTHFVHSAEWFHQWIERSAHYNLQFFFLHRFNTHIDKR